jgi:hypothetical protein
MPGRNTGTLGPTGTLTMIKNVNVAVGGTLSPTGDAAHPFNIAVSVGGGLSFMRVLIIGYSPYAPSNVSQTNQAATRDITIEQGASFRRYYRWMKSDGIPFDITLFTMKMTIKNIKDDGDLIIYSPDHITITTAGLEAGLFRVDIAPNITAALDFTRAVYQITAAWSSGTVKLLEGNVVLSRGLIREYTQSVGGALAISNTLIRNTTVSVGGALAMDGTCGTS